MNILVVDDQPAEAFYVRARLETDADHYTVVTAGNGLETLRLIAESSIDMVLLDVGLPDLDGFEVCRRIRAWEMETYGHAPVLPVVMVTGQAAQQRAEALDAGADD